MKNIIILMILVASFAIGAGTRDASEYKKHIGLKLKGNASGYQFDVPDDVYESSFYSDLRDMRIINATGDFVPMRTVLAHQQVVNEYSQNTLPFFTLNKTISNSIESRQTKTSIRGSQEDYTVTTSKSLKHYLKTFELEDFNQIIIDAVVLKGQKIESLEIKWHYKTAGNRIFTIDLSGSNNLVDWQSIRNNQKLVEINTNSRTFLENKIQLNQADFSYYKIKFVDGIVPEIVQITAWLVNQVIKKHHQIKKESQYSVVNEDTLKLDTGGLYWVDSFTISFNQENTITDLTLYSRNKINEKWRMAGSGTIYSMTSNGVTINNKTIKVRQSSHRFWKIKFDKNINIYSVDRIEMNGRKHQVKFLAQGKAPFTLLYGNPNKLKPVSSHWYYKIPKKLKNTLFSSNVTLVQNHDLPKKLNNSTVNNSINQENSNYAKWMFWIILTIVLFSLIIMAYKLLKETSEN